MKSIAATPTLQQFIVLFRASDKIPDETPEQIKEDKKIEGEEDGPEDRFVVLDPNNEEDRVSYVKPLNKNVL